MEVREELEVEVIRVREEGEMIGLEREEMVSRHKEEVRILNAAH